MDTVYAKIIGSVDDYLQNDHFVRIREKSDGRFIFTVKKPLSKNVLTKAEYETEISDPGSLEQALFLMGYKMANKVTKVRQTTNVGEFEICIDEVEDLGSFIEIEKISDEDSDAVRSELNDFLELLGVSASDEVHKGYDILIMENR